MAAEYSVNRRPIREAFIRLAEEDLLEIRPQRGNFVRRISLPAVLSTQFIREAAEADIMRILAGFGAVLAILEGDLVNVDLIADSLPDPKPFLLRLRAACTTCAFAVILIGPAWLYVSIGVRQTSPALGVRMDYIHFSVMALLLSLALLAALRIIGMILGTTDDLPKARPEHET